MGHIRWSDVRGVAGCRPPRLRLAVVVAAAVAGLAIMGHCASVRTLSAASDPLQLSSSTSLPSAVTATASQPRLVQGLPICKATKLLAIAALPKSANALTALGVVLTGLAGMGWRTQLLALAGRGPPGAPAIPLTGQDLLTRFCLARR